MHRGRDAQQHLSHQIEKNPCHKNRKAKLKNPDQNGEPKPSSPDFFARKLPKATSANNAVFMLGDAFAAEKSPTLRAARRRFAFRVMQTALARNRKCGCRTHASEF